MYNVLTKKVGVGDYSLVKRFRTYHKAYSYIGDKLQVKDTLGWSYSCKYLTDGYDKKKIFKYGDTYLRRKFICYKIQED